MTPDVATAPSPVCAVAQTGKANVQTEMQAEALRRVEAYLHGQQQRRKLYGAAGRIERVSEWGGGESGYQYDAAGDLIGITEANGRQRRYTYDDRRRLVQVEQDGRRMTRYRYDDALDRLVEVQTGPSGPQTGTRYQFDAQGRVAAIRHGEADVSVYRYDEAGRVRLARTAHVTTSWRYGADGRVSAIEQSLAGVTLRAELHYDAQGRLAAMRLPGSQQALDYCWDAQGRPQSVAIGGDVLVRFGYDDAVKTTTVELGNGVTERSAAHPLDGRALSLHVQAGDCQLLARRITYSPAGEILSDGEQVYRYDGLGRVIETATPPHRYVYDAMDNLISCGEAGMETHFTHDAQGRLLRATDQTGMPTDFAHDRWGRLVQRNGPDGVWDYCYDDGGLLQEVRHEQVTVARFLYDHKGRLVWAKVEERTERYLYGDADELLAVTDEQGAPVRLLVRTPLGVHAEIHGALGAGDVFFRHSDERGTLRLVTDAAGELCARFAYDPFGRPLTPPAADQIPHRSAAGHPLVLPPQSFTGRDWYAALGLYYFGARWYDPGLRRFLSPDSYTGAPDDVRLVSPLHAASRQAALRGQILGDWLKQPRVRNAYAFCGNDPIGRVDPNGHWSFGGVLLMLLGVIWTLPNTLLGILIEITCLVGEVIRWLVWLFSAGRASWETPGFDAAASGRLNAFALVFTGGWLGSFSGLLGITFGNVFFVYKQWEASPYIAALPDPIFPPAYNGRESIARGRMLYEHELRHTNQYGWFGPFYHFGLPLFGVYEWDMIIKGYRNAWTERDARAHAEP